MTTDTTAASAPGTGATWASTLGSIATIRRVAGAVIVIAGVVVLIALISTRMFARAPVLADLNDDLRPVMTDQSIAALRADLDGLEAANGEFAATVVPTVAAALDQTPEELNAFLGENFPAVVTGLGALPPTITQFRGLVDLLDAEQGRFESLDAIPAQDVTPETVPWAILVIGLLMVGLGAWLFVSRSTASAIATGVAGVVVVLATVALGLQGKAADADEIGRNVAPVFDEEVVAQARGALGAVGAMAEELEIKALPAIGDAAGIPEDQLPGFVAENFPALASALEALPETSARFAGAVDLIDRNIPRYERVALVPFGRVIWIVTWAAIVTTMLGLVAVVFGWSRERAAG